MQASRARAYNKGMIFTRRHDLSLVPSSLNISGDTHFHPITIITKDDPKLRDSQWLNSHRSSPVGRLSGTSLMYVTQVDDLAGSQQCPAKPVVQMGQMYWSHGVVHWQLVVTRGDLWWTHDGSVWPTATRIWCEEKLSLNQALCACSSRHSVYISIQEWVIAFARRIHN